MPEKRRQFSVFELPYGANDNAMIPGIHRVVQFTLEGGDGAVEQRDTALSLAPENAAEPTFLSRL